MRALPLHSCLKRMGAKRMMALPSVVLVRFSAAAANLPSDTVAIHSRSSSPDQRDGCLTTLEPPAACKARGSKGQLSESAVCWLCVYVCARVRTRVHVCGNKNKYTGAAY